MHGATYVALRLLPFQLMLTFFTFLYFLLLPLLLSRTCLISCLDIRLIFVLECQLTYLISLFFLLLFNTKFIQVDSHTWKPIDSTGKFGFCSCCTRHFILLLLSASLHSSMHSITIRNGESFFPFSPVISHTQYIYFTWCVRLFHLLFHPRSLPFLLTR